MVVNTLKRTMTASNTKNLHMTGVTTLYAFAISGGKTIIMLGEQHSIKPPDDSAIAFLKSLPTTTELFLEAPEGVVPFKNPVGVLVQAIAAFHKRRNVHWIDYRYDDDLWELHEAHLALKRQNVDHEAAVANFKATVARLVPTKSALISFMHEGGRRRVSPRSLAAAWLEGCIRAGRDFLRDFTENAKAMAQTGAHLRYIDNCVTLALKQVMDAGVIELLVRRLHDSASHLFVFVCGELHTDTYAAFIRKNFMVIDSHISNAHKGRVKLPTRFLTHVGESAD
jgi:hypothetical protein